MPNTNHELFHDRDEPKFEPWLGVVGASVIPVLLMLVLPRAVAPYLFTLTGLLLLAGIVLLIVQQRGAKQRKKNPEARA